VKDPLDRPLLRGVIHQYSFFLSLLAGGTLIALAAPPARVGVGIYAASLSALLGTSAVYHRVTWSVPTRRWVGRLDHSMINVLIAGTYTPFGLCAVVGSTASVLLLPIWAAAAAGIALHIVWFDAPKWLSALTYVVIGWIGAAAMPGLAEQLGWGPMWLLIAGGVLYSLGAGVYALRRPDPIPHVFGYHEVFHSLVVLAAMSHYAAVALVVRAGH
jgi:hemolysin III